MPNDGTCPITGDSSCTFNNQRGLCLFKELSGYDLTARSSSFSMLAFSFCLLLFIDNNSEFVDWHQCYGINDTLELLCQASNPCVCVLVLLLSQDIFGIFNTSLYEHYGLLVFLTLSKHMALKSDPQWKIQSYCTPFPLGHQVFLGGCFGILS